MEIALSRIVSGGQTGADRAALDWAIAHGVAHGGWCPRGRKAEDGAIDTGYRLRETPSDDYAQRTEWNVRDSDATVVFSMAAELTGGSKETVEFARKLGKPCLHLSAQTTGERPAERLREFLCQHGIKVLNVAGPRRSQEPAVCAFVAETLTKALSRHAER